MHDFIAEHHLPAVRTSIRTCQRHVTHKDTHLSDFNVHFYVKPQTLHCTLTLPYTEEDAEHQLAKRQALWRRASPKE